MDKFLNLLGMARRAGKLCMGHDSGIDSIVKNRAQLCIISSSASDRLKKEFTHACNYQGKNIAIINAHYDMGELSNAIGSKASVVTVTDEGFAKKLVELYG